MAREQFSNFAESTLDGGINNSVTSLTVSDASLFPSEGNFRILIDDEILLVTNVSGSTFTVSRGQEGTSAASHSNGAAVDHVLTAGALDQFRADSASSDTWSNLITAGAAGRLFLPSDAPYLVRDNESALQYFGPMRKVVPPVNGDFAWINQGSATVSTANGGVYISDPVNASLSMRIRKKSAPSTPYTVTMMALPVLKADSFNFVGMCFRESSSGKLETLHWIGRTSATSKLEQNEWNSPTSFQDVVANVETQFVPGGPPPWLQIEHDGTDLYYRYSQDGWNWVTFESHTDGNFFTSAPDEIGFCAGSNGGDIAAMFVISWEEA